MQHKLQLTVLGGQGQKMSQRGDAPLLQSWGSSTGRVVSIQITFSRPFLRCLGQSGWAAVPAGGGYGRPPQAARHRRQSGGQQRWIIGIAARSRPAGVGRARRRCHRG